MILDNGLAKAGVVLFTTPGCPHCPHVRELSGYAAQKSPDVQFAEVSAVDQFDLAAAMKVRSAPTVLAFYDGVEVDRVVGTANANEIERVFNSAGGNVSEERPSMVSSENRKIRTAAGAALIAAGLISQVIWLVLIGAALVAAGWYDRILVR